jgi:hypothetical protein
MPSVGTNVVIDAMRPFDYTRISREGVAPPSDDSAGIRSSRLDVVTRKGGLS